MKPKRPLLRYFGGKWQLRHWVLEHLPPHQFYAEPFAGAASILLAKDPAPKGEIINDLNRDVVNLFGILRDQRFGDELLRQLGLTPYSKAEFELAREPSDQTIERARRFVVRSFMGITVAGMDKTLEGKAGATGFRMENVSITKTDSSGRPTFRNCAAEWDNWRQALPAIVERLQRVMIYEMDAIKFIRQMDSPETLLYVDPPYCHSTRSTTRYSKEFTEHDHLADVLADCKAKVVLSGYPCPQYEILEVLYGWKRVEKDYRANMSLERRTECLWISPNAQ